MTVTTSLHRSPCLGWRLWLIPALLIGLACSLPPAINRLVGHPVTVVDPESGLEVLPNELILIGSQAEVTARVAELGGQITQSVPETGTFQARFPVKDLAALKTLRAQLEEEGFRAALVYILEP